MSFLYTGGTRELLGYVCGRYFSGEVWARGETYARNEYVVSAQRYSNEVRFTVRGSGGVSYQVSIHTRIQKGELEASCGCPCDFPCKHMAAAILIGFAGDYFLPDADEILPGDATSPSHPMLDYLDGKHTWQSGVLGRQSGNRSPSEAVAGKKYLPYVLLVAPEHSGVLGHSMQDAWKLDLYGRYLKKDGSPGGFHRWKPGMQLEPSTAELELLQEAALRIHDRRVLAAFWLQWIIDETSIPLLIPAGRSPVEAAAAELEHIEVEFWYMERFGREGFYPWFRCTATDGIQYDECDAEQLRLIAQGPTHYLLDMRNRVLFDITRACDARRQVAAIDFLRMLITCKPPYSRQGIHQLEAGVSARTELSEAVRIIPPPRVEDVPCGEPLFRLYISTRNSPGVSLVPMVDYGYGEAAPLTHEELWRVRLQDGSRELRAADLAGEQEFLDKLDNLPLDTSPGSSLPSYEYYSDAAPLELLQAILQQFAREIRESTLEILLNKVRATPLDSITVQTSSGIDWLGIHAQVDEQPISPQQIDRVWRALITRSGYRIISHQLLESLIALQENSLHEDEIRIHELDIAAAPPLETLLKSCPPGAVVARTAAGADGERSNLLLQQLLQRHEQLEDVFAGAGAPPAAGFRGELRDYQQSGLRWLRFLRSIAAGGILADDMGLGKTIQAIALLADYRAEGCRLPALVVAPVSTLNNWRRELARFFPEESVRLHAGSSRGELPATPCTILCSYQTMLRDIALFSARDFSLILLDEGQQFKNSRTKLYAATARLQGMQKIILSGTPMENSIMDLWSLMSIANPGLLSTRKAFKQRYAGAGVDEQTLSRLQQRIRPYFLRRTKEMIADELPGKSEIDIGITQYEAEAAFYVQQEAACRQKVIELLDSENPQEAGIAILQTLTHLRQTAIAPELVGGPAQSAKLDTVCDKLAEAAGEGHSVLVFSQFVRVLTLIQQRLDAAGLDYAYLDGSCSAAQRNQQIDSFRRDSRIQIFLLSLKAGGVGINLTEADYVCIVDPWWNPAVESQAIDRSHRIGQTRQVLAMRFIAENTIEERVRELQLQKQELIDGLFGSGGSLFSSLDREDILQLAGSS